MFNNPIFSYIGLGVACAAVVLGVIMPEWAVVAWTVAGVLGYGSVASIRTFIDSKGWKTYAIFFVILVSAGLEIFAVITPELFQALIVAFAPITGITLQQSLAKSSSSFPKVNGS